MLPWAITAIALIAVIALVAGRNFGLGLGSSTPAVQPEGASSDQPVAGDAPFANGDASGGPVVRAPDISAMSPAERADRLFDRVMRLKEQGKRTSTTISAGSAR